MKLLCLKSDLAPLCLLVYVLFDGIYFKLPAALCAILNGVVHT